jgi:hypothetical protein
VTHGHDHPHHDNDHHHDHHHHERAYGGPVVVDVGGGFGALVLRLDAEALGTEPHLRSLDDPSFVTHTGVWERSMGTRTIVAAVFPSLPVGRYVLLDAEGNDTAVVTIGDGRVTELDHRPVALLAP